MSSVGGSVCTKPTLWKTSLKKTWRTCWIITLSGFTVLWLFLETIRYRISKVISTYHMELKSSFQKETTTQWH